MRWLLVAQQRSRSCGSLLRGLASVAFSSLPVIDVRALIDPCSPSAARAEVGRQLHSACANVGFFYVTGHGVPRQEHEGVVSLARRWFALPEAVKRQIELSPRTSFRGYQALGANVTRYVGGFSRDWHEGIDLYKEAAPGGTSPIHGLNPWPTQLPEFDAALRQYIDACLGLGQALMRGIALGLQLPETFFESEDGGGTTASTSYWVARVIHYPPLPQSGAGGAEGVVADAQRAASGADVDRSVQLSCGEHSDYGLLTIVNQEAGVEALQVKNGEGRWVDAPPVDGAFVCNIGDMLRVFTNGAYVPTLHRVVNADPTRSRVSVAFFYEPSYDCIVRPLPQLRRAADALPAVRYGAHLESKVLRNFE